MRATDDAILAYISRYRLEHGCSPSLREIARRFGYQSHGSVANRLWGMRERGLVEYEDGMPRTVRPGDGDRR